MKQQRLTHPNNRRHLTLQTVLLLLLFPVPTLAQVNDRVKDQSDEDSQAQVQRKTAPVIDLERIRFTLDDKRPEPKSSMFTRTARSSNSAPQADPDLSNFAVFVNAGVVVPHSDLSTFLDPGFSLNAGLEYMFTSQFSVEGTVGLHRFETFFDDVATLYQVSANGKFYLVDQSTKVRPFVNGGVGAYVTDSGTSHFGGNVGGGILYEVTPHVGIQGAYNFHMVNLGSNTRFSTLQGGVRFRF